MVFEGLFTVPKLTIAGCHSKVVFSANVKLMHKQCQSELAYLPENRNVDNRTEQCLVKDKEKALKHLNSFVFFRFTISVMVAQGGLNSLTRL